MIRELICYRCVCAKCKHTWVTKGHDLPMVCPKCKSRTWNVDFSFADDFAHVQPIIKPAATNPTKQFSDVSMNDAMAEFLEQAEVVEDEPEPVDEWEGWSDEQEEYDGSTGETIIFRKQLVRPFRIQKIRSEH